MALALAAALAAVTCVVVGASPATGQAAPGGPTSGEYTPIDFTGWVASGGSSSWSISPDGSEAQQSINGTDTFLVSTSEDLDELIDYEVRGTVVVDTVSDDDHVGLSFGHQSPMTMAGTERRVMDSVLFAWKQDYQDWEGTTIPEGFSLSKLNGTFPSSEARFWEPVDGVEVLTADFGPNKGWQDDVEHEIRAQYRSDGVEVWVDGEQVIEAVGSFDPGRFALFNFSQPDAVYKDFEWRALTTPDPLEAVAGEDFTVDEGDTVTLDGSATGAGASGATLRWDIVGAEGPPIQLSSPVVGNPSFVTSDDGTYRLRLTATTDEGSDTDEILVTVENEVPEVTSVDTAPTGSDRLAQVTIGLSDPGSVDTHEVEIDWGDGGDLEILPVTLASTGWGYVHAGHRFAADGEVEATVVAIDDDGGRSAPETVVIDVGSAVGEGPEMPALFGWTTDYPNAVKLMADGNVATGPVHANTTINLSGTNHTLSGGTTHVSGIEVYGTGHVIDPSAVAVAAQPLPYEFSLADYQPGGRAALAAGADYHVVPSSACSGGMVSTWTPTTTLDEGLWYTTCNAEVDTDLLDGPVTIVADGFVRYVGSSAVETSPYIDDLSAMSTGWDAAALDLQASNLTVNGSLFTINGDFWVLGDDNTLGCGAAAPSIWIMGSGNTSESAACQGGGDSGPIPIGASPVLVPTLDASITPDQSTVRPGEQIDFEGEVSNGAPPVGAPPVGGGGRLLVPVLFGMDNPGVASATVGTPRVQVEYQETGSGDWVLLGDTDPGATAAARIVDLTSTPIPISGVTYEPEPAGTVVPAGSVAAWTAVAALDLTVAQIELLLDPAEVAEIRLTTTVPTTGDPAATLVSRVGADLLEAVREAPAGAVEDATITFTTTGGAQTYDSTDEPDLDHLAPADTATVTQTVDVPDPGAVRDSESNTAYRARLAELDGSAVIATVQAAGASGAGPLVARPAMAAANVAVPILETELVVPPRTQAGLDAVWTLTVTNTGSATATDITADFTLSETGPVAVTGLPTTLAPDATATITGSWAAPPTQVGEITAEVEVTWAQVDGDPGQYGPLTHTAITQARPELDLKATKIDRTDLVGLPTGQIDYLIEVRNEGATALTDVVVTDELDATTLVTGSVAASAGSVDVSVPGVVEVTIDQLDPLISETITFRVDTSSVPSSATEVTNQATIASSELDDVVTDDPDVPGADDPTLTPHDGGGGPGGSTSPGPSLDDCDIDEGDTLTAPQTITCTLVPLTGTTVDTWTVAMVPTGGDPAEAISIGTGTGTTIEVDVDPTILANGLWDVVITVTGSDDGRTETTLPIIIDGRLKLGRYSVAYEDLNVPVEGIPIQIVRSYDTLNRHRVGDFGYGWDLQIANFTARSNRPLGSGAWQQYECGVAVLIATYCYQGTAPRFVSVTWPDGRVETFDLTPRQSPPAFSFLTPIAYTGRPGTTSRLDPAPNDQFAMFVGDAGGQGQLYEAFTHRPYIPDQWILTDTTGNRYTIDREVGLVETTTLNGQRLWIDETGVRSSAGPAVSFERDDQGRISGLTGPSGEVRGYEYDPVTGDLLEATNGRQQADAFTYDGDHRLETLPSGGSVPLRSVSYDPITGRVDGVTSGGRTTELIIDVDSRTETTVSPAADRITVATYDSLGDIESRTVTADGRSLEWKFDHDAQGRITWTQGPTGSEASAIYDARGNLTSYTDAANRVSTFTYGAWSRPVVRTISGETVETRTYDPAGNIETVSEPGRGTTEYNYAAGRLAEVIDPLGRSMTIAYDADGYPTTVNTTAGTIRRSVDDSGRLRAHTDPSGVATTFGYDADGNLTTITSQDGATQSWGYDSLNRVTTETDKHGQVAYKEYNSDGSLYRTYNRRSQSTTYGYDPNGALQSISTTDEVVTIDVDGFGRPSELGNDSAVIELGWSDDGFLVSETTQLVGRSEPASVVTYVNNGVGDMTSVTGLGSTTSYIWDDQGRLEEVADTQAGTFEYTYDPDDRLLASMTRPNGLTDEFVFDEGSRLLARSAINGISTVNAAGYTYNAAGQRDSLTSNSGSHLYGYNDTGRLTSANYPSSFGHADEAFNYDHLGNRSSWTGNSATQVQYSFDRLTRDSHFVYEYDDDGNQVRRTTRGTSPQQTDYEWDAKGQLVAVDPPGTALTQYEYDPLGRRIIVNDSGTRQRIIWARDNVLGQMSTTGAAEVRAVTSAGIDNVLALIAPSDIAYPLVDGLGSVVAVSDDEGNVTSSRAYSAFGSATPPSTGTRLFDYVGLQRDSSGLIYSRARYYDPEIGRFISEDPVPAANRYTYANASPVNFVDPFGEMAIPAFSAIIDRSARIAAVTLGVALVGSDIVGNGFDAAGLFESAVQVGGMFASSQAVTAATTAACGKHGGAQKSGIGCYVAVGGATGGLVSTVLGLTTMAIFSPNEITTGSALMTVLSGFGGGALGGASTGATGQGVLRALLGGKNSTAAAEQWESAGELVSRGFWK